MAKKTKSLFIVGGVLISIGLILALISLISNDFKILGFDKSTYVTNTHTIHESFDDIIINSDTADIEFLVSLDGQTKVECFELENETHEVSVQNGKLNINVINNKKWYEFIGINFKTPKIKIYLNKFAFNTLMISENTGDINILNNFSFANINILASTGNVYCYSSGCELTKIYSSTGNIELIGAQSKTIDINTSTGNINLNNVNSTSIKIDSSTGNTTLTNVSTFELNSNASTGDITLNNVIGSKFLIERSTGDVVFNKCDGDELTITTDTGDVTGTFLSNKVFMYETDTGDVILPSAMSGGKCVITTDTGDIKISIVS